MKSLEKIYQSLFFALSLAFSACSGHHDGHEPQILNINYPAAYVVNGESGNLSVIRTLDYVSTETISLNGAMFPHHVYINPSKTKLAIAITGKDLSAGHGDHSQVVQGLKIQIIDAVTGKIDKEIPVSKMPHNAIFNSAGTELWLGQADDVKSQVLVYSTDGWSLLKTMDAGKGVSEISFSEDGKYAFACNTNDNTLTIIDAVSKTVLKTLPTGDKPVGAWPGGAGCMFVDNEAGQSITEIIISDSVRIGATIPLGFKPGFAAWNKTGEELWVSDASNGRVVYFEKSPAGEWTVSGNTVTGADAHAIAFSAEDKIAWVTNQGAGTVSVLDAQSHSLIKNIAVGSKPNGIALK